MASYKLKNMQFHVELICFAVHGGVFAVAGACTPPPPHNRGTAASYVPSTRPERAGTTSEVIPVARRPLQRACAAAFIAHPQRTVCSEARWRTAAGTRCRSAVLAVLALL